MLNLKKRNGVFGTYTRLFLFWWDDDGRGLFLLMSGETFAHVDRLSSSFIIMVLLGVGNLKK